MLTRPAWSDAVGRRRRRRRCTRARAPPTTCARSPASPPSASGPLVVAYADIVTQREVLAGLLAEPRIAHRRPHHRRHRRAARTASRRARSRGRIVSAGSPYHAVRRPTGTFLGVLKVAPADRPGVAPVAERLAALVEPAPPADWQEELDYKAGHWHRMLALFAMDRAPGEPAPGREVLDAADAVAGGRRRARAPARDRARRRHRAAARRAHPLGRARRRLAPALAVLGAPRLAGRARARRGRRSSSTTRTASCSTRRSRARTASSRRSSSRPYSKYIARWAARRGHDAEPGDADLDRGRRAGRRLRSPPPSAGAWSRARCSLYFAFVLDCVDGQLARYTRQFSKLGAWLDSIFDRTKEYVVFAGLAIGASRTGDPVWLLAGAALALQTARHAIDFSYPGLPAPGDRGGAAAADREPVRRPAARLADDRAGRDRRGRGGGRCSAPLAAARPAQMTLRRRLGRLWRAGDRNPAVRWLKKIIAFPIGERFAAISITAALFDARTPCSSSCSRGAASRPPTSCSAARCGRWSHERRDRPQRSRAGERPRERARALPRRRAARRGDRARARPRPSALPAIALLLVAGLPLAGRDRVEGDGASHGLVAGVVAWAVLVGGLASARPLDDRLRWTVPSGAARDRVRGPAVDRRRRGRGRAAGRRSRCCAAITYHHYDTVYGFRHRGVPPPRVGPRGRRAAGTAGCVARRWSCCSPARCRPASGSWPGCSRRCS